MKTRPIRFFHHGAVVEVSNAHPTRSVLDWLREDARCTGTKEGCNEGDCGACTVVIGELPEHSMSAGSAVRGLSLRTVNACIQFLPTLDGKALFTVEDLKAMGESAQSAQSATLQPVEYDKPHAVKASALHPVQQAMVECHGSQCGFCTPGFVMSLWSTYEHHKACGTRPTRQQLADDLSGNLCRCTGYRPILDAGQHMFDLPALPLDTAPVIAALKALQPESGSTPGTFSYAGLNPDKRIDTFHAPRTLAALAELREHNPKAQLLAGSTDVGLWVTKQHRQLDEIIDLTQVEELRHIEDQPDQLLIGAAVTLADAFAALVNDRPQLHHFASRFAGLPVRNSGTLGGNIANGSPIGDSMPLLIALGASVVLASVRGQRELPLEALYTGYRTNVMAADEVLAFVKVPKAAPDETMKVYKISKRYDDDISAVCLAIKLHIENSIVVHASIGAGGVAATPARAVQTEAALTGQPWTLQTVQQAMAVLRAEFSPISDMRASGAYRREVLGNLLQRYWLESQGVQQINLESFVLEERA